MSAAAGEYPPPDLGRKDSSAGYESYMVGAQEMSPDLDRHEWDPRVGYRPVPLRPEHSHAL